MLNHPDQSLSKNIKVNYQQCDLEELIYHYPGFYQVQASLTIAINTLTLLLESSQIENMPNNINPDELRFAKNILSNFFSEISSIIDNLINK